MAATAFALAASPMRGTMRPSPAEYEALTAETPTELMRQTEREAKAAYDDFVRPAAFPIPKGDDDGQTN